MKQNALNMYTKVTLQDGRIFFTKEPVLFVTARNTVFFHVLIQGEKKVDSSIVEWREDANTFSTFDVKYLKFIS